MNANKVIYKNLVIVCVLSEIYLRLNGCDWSRCSFIEVNFSNLTDNAWQHFFMNHFVCIHYHLCEVSAEIIACKIFTSYELSILLSTLWWLYEN